MDKRSVNIISGCLAAAVTIGAITVHNCGSVNDISLQSPSLIGPNAIPFSELESAAYEEATETGYVPISLGNASVDIDDYTFVAMTSYTDIASEFGSNPADPVTYDGKTYWLKNDTILVDAKVESSETDKSVEIDEDEVTNLKIGDTVVRIAYTKQWSQVKLADGKQGYVRSCKIITITSH